MVASDRLSAFDVVMPKGIPYKGQILNQIATKMMAATDDILPNWLIATPDPNVAIGYRCVPFKVEMVIRGYLSGHAAREYKAGKHNLCGVEMPNGMIENDAFPRPIITPSIRAEKGHDEDISEAEILNQGIVDEILWTQIKEKAFRLFERGTEVAKSQGLILVDTKYEMGVYNGELTLIDEVHTTDSSRYFYLDGYEERQSQNAGQKQLSKEFLREWLMDHKFQGLEGQTLPELPNTFRLEVYERYSLLFEMLTKQTFKPQILHDFNQELEDIFRPYTS